MQEIRMLQLNFQKGWRGGERQTLYNMIGFRNAGCQVSLLCRKGSLMESRAKAEGFDIKSTGNILSVILFLAFKCRKYNILHAQTSHIFTYAVITKFFHRGKVIYTRRIDKAQHGRFTKWKYHQADKVIAISEAVREIVEKFINRKVVVISDIGVVRKLDEIHAQKLMENVRYNKETKIIATTSALTRDKAPDDMVEAIRILNLKRKDFIFLHFGSGDLWEEIEKLIKDNHLEDVYYLMGFADNVEDIFFKLDVFAMSSEMEGLGSSVLDAFLYKVPVASTDAGGLKELVEDGRGILCKKNSPKLLAAGIEELLYNPELSSKITTNAFQYVKHFHSIEYITNQYMELINSLFYKSKNSRLA
ncbi:MAG: glycosyltransferase [Ginsengibacter sp.]